MPEEKKLPPLPGSTDEDLKQNRYHPFFKKTTREFWEGAEINHSQLKEKEKCDHYFKFSGNGVECEKCSIGFTGNIEVKNGKLFYQNSEVIF